MIVVGDEDADDEDVIVVEDESPLEEVVEEEPFASIVEYGDDPFDGQDVPAAVQQEIRDALTDGEKIVWVGRPSLALMPAGGVRPESSARFCS